MNDAQQIDYRLLVQRIASSTAFNLGTVLREAQAAGVSLDQLDRDVRAARTQITAAN